MNVTGKHSEGLGLLKWPSTSLLLVVRMPSDDIWYPRYLREGSIKAHFGCFSLAPILTVALDNFVDALLEFSP